MKFQAFLTDNGVNLLEKRFVPALEKIGKICHLFLTRDHAVFLHNLLNGDGIQSVLQFRREILFEEYRISSKNDDKIAFTVDVSLLRRALISAAGVCADQNRLRIKLVKKLPARSTVPAPFLSFETEGLRSAVIQDVPISKPMSRAEIAELQSALDSAQELPPTLVQALELSKLQSYVDRMKNFGEVLGVTVSKRGELRLQISTLAVKLGVDFKRLAVLGDRADPAAEGEGDSQSKTVLVSLKHLAKSLYYHLAKPDCAFYGISPLGSSLTVIFQFLVPGSQQTDKSISLHCRLPVLDSGDG